MSTGKFDRSAFKPTKVQEALDSDKKLDEDLGRTTVGDFINLQKGKNILRIYPPHPSGGGKLFAEPKVTVFLPILQQEYKDGRPVEENGRPKMGLKNKSVFNSKQHGNTKKDLVEEYNKIVEDQVVSLFPGEWKNKEVAQKRNDYLKHIRGNWEEKIQGTQYRPSWVMYVDHRVTFESKPTFGRLEIGVSIKDRLNKISITADSGDDVLSVDPFTDVNDGRAVVVTKNPDAKPAEYYTTDLDTTLVPTSIQGKVYQLPRTMPLSDEQLEDFMKVQPLVEMYHNVFTRRDLLLQIEGLQNVDKAGGYRVFENPEFIALIEEMQDLFPKTSEDSDDMNEQEIQKEQESDSLKGDAFDLMDRVELLEYIMDNGVGVKVEKTMSDEEVKSLIRGAINGNTEPTQVEVSEELPDVVNEETTELPTEEEKSEQISDARRRLMELKKKTQQG